jgi:hypothetical protein
MDMVTAVKLFAVLLGFLFPVFLIRAVRAGPEDHDRVTNYTALSSLSIGALIFILMCLLPNG